MLKWFSENNLRVNPKKYVLLRANDELCLKIQELFISNSRCEKLYGIEVDHELSFEHHIESLCKEQVKNLMHCHELLHL